MPQVVTIPSLPSAFELVKAIQGQGQEWGEGYRALGRDAIAAFCKSRWRSRLTNILIPWPHSTRPTVATAATGAIC
jgi:hypothetical protein